MNWWMVFGAGLLAGATTCAATQGALLVGLITRSAKQSRTASRSIGDDLAPVSGFLLGKLVSHTLLGAALGALGSVLSISPRIGGMVQWLAGLVMVALGLGTLGFPGLRNIKFTPPASWSNQVRKSTRSQSALAPAMLGVATIFIPCGVTLSMELLAATSGNAVLGAMVMAVFVLGTAPLFTVFGVIAQRYAGRLHWLSVGMGAAVVGMGLVTINGAMVSLGSPVSFQGLTGTQASPSATAEVQDEIQVVEIEAENYGFSPTVISAKAGVETKLVFHTENVHSCILSVVLPSLNQQFLLPSTGEKEVNLGVLTAGTVPISCSMGMYTASIQVI